MEEKRAILENFSEQRPTHIGDVMDPENEIENEEAENEQNEDYERVQSIPSEGVAEGSQVSPGSGLFKRTDISRTADIFKLARTLDPDQRFAFDLEVKFVKQYQASMHSGEKDLNHHCLRFMGVLGSEKVLS